MAISLGIDFGTSGARAIAIDSKGDIQAEAQFPFSDENQPWVEQWQTGLWQLLEQTPEDLRSIIQAIAVDGTSSTVLLGDVTGQLLTAPLLYNDARAVAAVAQLRQIAPPHHPVLSATSSLAKFIWLTQNTEAGHARYLMHQADWLGFLLHGQLGISDYHNSLKLGYDVEALCYPDWLATLPGRSQFPQVVAPGAVIAPVTRAIVNRFGFPANCQVCAGTTDSIAAFLASGVTTPGEAVTSLGSTLVLKLLSQNRVEDSRYGIYSHRLGDLWLVGGASNTGGAVLRHFFNDVELSRFSQQINPEWESPLQYYPLLQKGDRFPVNDPELLPQLSPRPADPVEFLHGLLTGIARIEATAYRLLQDLGATPLTRVYTAGGGAANATWAKIRQRLLGVPVESARQTQAAYGAALLAQQAILAQS